MDDSPVCCLFTQCYFCFMSHLLHFGTLMSPAFKDKFSWLLFLPILPWSSPPSLWPRAPCIHRALQPLWSGCSVSYHPVFLCSLQYICLYLWSEISSRLPLINYTPLHTHTTTHHQLSSMFSLPREIIQRPIPLLRAQTCSNGKEAAFHPLSPVCFTNSSSFIHPWDSIFVPVFFPSTCFPPAPWFWSHLFAHTTQTYGSRQDLSPEHQILHHWLPHLQWFPWFLNWIMRSSDIRTMPRSPTCMPQGLHFRKHLVYFHSDAEVSE